MSGGGVNPHKKKNTHNDLLLHFSSYCNIAIIFMVIPSLPINEYFVRHCCVSVFVDCNYELVRDGCNYHFVVIA